MKTTYERLMVSNAILGSDMTCTNAGGQTKGANEKSIVLVHQHGRDDVT